VTFQLADVSLGTGQVLINSGAWNLTQGTYTNLGTTNNAAGGTITLSSGSFVNQYRVNNSGSIVQTSGDYINYGTTTNTGSITLSRGDFLNQTDSVLINAGTITLSNGQFVNQSAVQNQSGGKLTVTAGNFQNQAGGVLTNNGNITLTAGNFDNYSGGTMSGNGLLTASGNATFHYGSTLQGNPTVTAALLNLQGLASPGGSGTVGQMTFDATTHFQGTVLVDLVTPGKPGIGSDLIQIAGGHTGTIESGAGFNFHQVTPTENISDKYEIISGNVAINSRPVVTDDAPNRRIVLRTDQDGDGFSDQGTAYYALVARNASYEQLARNNGGSGNQITFGRYLDQFLPQDDHTIGTANADLQWIRDTLDLMPDDVSVVHALGQMSGEIYAPLASVALQRQFVAYNQLAGHLRDGLFQACSMDQPVTGGADDAASSAANVPAGGWVSRGWVTGYGFGGALTADANADGCSYGGGGTQVVYGYQPTQQAGFGFFYDFGALNLTNDFGDRADSEAHSFGGYLTWHRDFDYFMFVGGGGFADYHATRSIKLENPDNVVARTAHGTSQGGQAAVYGEYGLNVQWENVHLRPYLGLLYMNVLQNAFQETDAGALDLGLDDSSINSFRTLLGTQIDFRCAPTSSLVWSLRGVWMHEYVNDATGGAVTAGLVAIPDSGFSLARPTTGSDWFVAGCGVRGAFFTGHWRPFANYDLVVNDKQAIHAGFGGIEFLW
jgi:hypothetical protein